MFAGVALQALAERIPKKVWGAVFMMAVLLPGVFSIIQLHPYEYVYYNSLTGGVAGAEGKYPLDYWNIVFKEAMDYVDDNLPAKSSVLVWKDDQLGQLYLKRKFKFVGHTGVDEAAFDQFDYAVMRSGQYAEFALLQNAQVLYVVRVDGIPLVDVLQIHPGGDE